MINVDRQQALEELTGRLTNVNLVKHSLAVEAIMRGLAEFFKENEENWALAGLLHDIDYDKTMNEPLKHGVLGAEILENLGVIDAIIYAVKAHNDRLGLDRKRKMDKALYSADPVSGLITAAALILPSKKLQDVTVDFILKRFNEKGFARGANREQILKCSELDMTLEQFLEIALKSMQKISDELGL
jgi:putative nucleotidyltransferase with HDIG domain